MDRRLRVPTSRLTSRPLLPFATCCRGRHLLSSSKICTRCPLRAERHHGHACTALMAEPAVSRWFVGKSCSLILVPATRGSFFGAGVSAAPCGWRRPGRDDLAVKHRVSMMCRTSVRNCRSRPAARDASEALASAGNEASSGVSNRPGAMGDHLDQLAGQDRGRSAWARQLRPGRRVGGSGPIWTVECRHRGGVNDDAALFPIGSVPWRPAFGAQSQQC